MKWFTERGLTRVVIVALALWLGVGTLRSQFASQGTFAGNGSGTANAQTATLSNVGALADVVGVPITYIAPATNTGPATFNLSSLGAIAINRPVPAGLATLAGGEIISGQLITLVYDGTRFQLQNSARPEPPGAIIDYAGSSCPTGTFSANSQTQSATTYPALFAVLSTSWGTSGGNVVLPDLRGRATYGIDANVSGFANRITVAGGNFDGSVFANTGGTQNQTLALTQIPAFNPASTINAFTPTGTTNTPVFFTGGGFGYQSGGTGFNIGIVGLAMGTVTLTGSTIGGGLPHPILAPAAIVQKCVRA